LTGRRLLYGPEEGEHYDAGSAQIIIKATGEQTEGRALLLAVIAAFVCEQVADLIEGETCLDLRANRDHSSLKDSTTPFVWELARRDEPKEDAGRITARDASCEGEKAVSLNPTVRMDDHVGVGDV
jgi:hypothetical protein